MADNVPITAGAGTNIATDDRSGVAAVGGHVQRTSEIGETSKAITAAAPTTTAATAIAARDTRRSALFINRGTQTVYIGAATVTAANGIPLDPGDSFVTEDTTLWQMLAASGTGDLRILELYD